MKLSLANLNKIMDVCTKKEIDVIIYIAQFQDEYGVIKGINYKDVLDNAEISKSTFYKLLYSLEEKEIIKINFINEYSFWEVTLIDNVFMGKEDYKKGYLKLNFEILHSKAFKAMTKSEKLIVLHLLRINDFRKEKIKITYAKIMEWTGKTLRSVKKFISTLSATLNIIKKGNLCLVDCLFGFASRTKSEADIYNSHMINYRLKKARSQASEKEIKDVSTLFKQYTGVHSIDRLIGIVDIVISKFGTLIPAYINKLINYGTL